MPQVVRHGTLGTWFLFSSLVVSVYGSIHGAYYGHGHHNKIAKRATGITSPDDPTQTGTISTCNLWYDIVDGDTCASVEEAFGITSEQFLAWNPAVSSDCETNFWVSDSYCVGTGTVVASSATSTTSSSTSSSGSMTAITTGPDEPTPTGQASNCNAWSLY
ncbi:hypothetical protein N7507_003485 [Penicillium longicatenatum]|nr:hypothetical protein N7507_003485 [Penicillium longicatenatum]